MQFMKVWPWFVVALLATTGLATAQSTSGTISGRAIDSQDRPMAGVTVSVESANLQGVRTAVTSANGDYIITLLPPDAHTITFELSGFQQQQRTITLVPTQVLPVNATMGLAAISETVEVDGPGDRCADADRSGRDEFQPGSHLDTSDQPRHQCSLAPRHRQFTQRGLSASTRLLARCRTRTCSW